MLAPETGNHSCMVHISKGGVSVEMPVCRLQLDGTIVMTILSDVCRRPIWASV